MTPGSILPDLPRESRILAIRLRSIGDIVLLTPALRLLKEWRPDLRVSVLVESRFRELLKGNPDMDEVLEIMPHGILSQLALMRAVRRRGFALCLNLHGGPKSTLLTRASGARCKAGFEHFRARGAYDVLVPDARTILDKVNIHTAEHQASAFFYLGMPRREIPRARLVVSPEARDWWRAERERSGPAAGLPALADKPYAILHPAALYATKQWAPEKFAPLGAWLAREAGLEPVYSCGAGESGVLDEVERASGGRIRRLEGAGLGQFAAALEGASLFVGNDSGPAHMAAALERPVVVIFGSSSSVIWGPWPRPVRPLTSRRAAAPVSIAASARVVQNAYPCNPCPGDRCYRFERPECILSITFDQVRAAVEEVLKETAARGSKAV